MEHDLFTELDALYVARAKALLDRVQMRQDRGMPWGVAVRNAVADTLAE